MNARTTIRQAADIMRARAEKATPGPWRAVPMGSEGARVGPRTGDKWTDVHWIANVNGRVMPEDGYNAAHMASWHPAVALAAAEMLTSTADDIESCAQAGYDVENLTHPPHEAMLTFARAYLGGAS